jgi:hypothetical protein
VRELVKKWGYKECPRCGHGLRRMFGCSHMQCKCGAHWCWGCRQNINECGGCADEDDGERSEYDSDDENEGAVEEVHTLPNEEAATGEENGSNAGPQERVDTPQPPTADTRRERTNYDARPDHYWQQQELDFGPEPGDDDPGLWGCDHKWEVYKPEEHDAEAEPECHQCWDRILLNQDQGSLCFLCGIVVCVACKGEEKPSS